MKGTGTMEREHLYQQLISYGESDVYPFHMPGHKRRALPFPNPYTIDITEIDGFDNLHHAGGLIREAEERAAKLYGADRSYYLVNGSTCGLLAAICAAARRGDKVLAARNCHKAVYHAVSMQGLSVEFLYPAITRGDLQGQITAAQVEEALTKHPDIAVVILTSPTYEGIVSDVAAIAACCHAHGAALIVDEAHGAHFGFGAGFPENAVRLGADAVIMSLHKTLPALTQTAVLHRASDRIMAERVEHYLEIFETSSPSYVLMGSISQCMQWMRKYADTWFEAYFTNLIWFREHAEKWKELRLWENPRKEPSKLVVLTGEKCSGTEAAKWLREEFQIEVEMAAAGYILAMTSLADSRDGFVRLMDALTKIDERLQKISFSKEKKTNYSESVLTCPEVEMLPVQAVNALEETKSVNEAEGFVSAEYGMVYPPGIPFLVPGEKITKTVLNKIENAKKAGLHLFGFADASGQTVQVVKEEKKR